MLFPVLACFFIWGIKPRILGLPGECCSAELISSLHTLTHTSIFPFPSLWCDISSLLRRKTVRLVWRSQEITQSTLCLLSHWLFLFEILLTMNKSCDVLLYRLCMIHALSYMCVWQKQTLNLCNWSQFHVLRKENHFQCLYNKIYLNCILVGCFMFSFLSIHVVAQLFSWAINHSYFQLSLFFMCKLKQYHSFSYQCYLTFC